MSARNARSKEKKDEQKISNLVLFKTHKNKVEKPEITSYESIDQENKIKLVHKLYPFAGSYLFSVLMVNQSLAPITEVKIKVKYPDFLYLARYKPPYLESEYSNTNDDTIKQIKIELDQLAEKSKKQLNFYFKPINLGNQGAIKLFSSFVNSKDYVRVLNADPINIRAHEVGLIEPKIVPSYAIEKFYNNEHVKKALRSFGIDAKENLNLYFNYVEQVLKAHHFQLITEDKENRVAWFFGRDLDAQEDILVVGRIVANKIEFLCASRNPDILISLLTNFSNALKKRLMGTGIIESVDQVYELECYNCGSVLPHFPERGEIVECPKCGEENMVW
ncbi:MAG: hypothetical protein ACOC35_04990 [Promethearchaeia archaeon]